MLVNIAIVEDDPKETEKFCNNLNRYAKENPEYTFQYDTYSTATAFLFNYQPTYNIVFMDIEMPGLNGMDAAHKLRTMDENVTLVFVTNLANFAVNGYEVNAFDFVVKPVPYPSFNLKMQRIMKKLEKQVAKSILLKHPDGIVRLQTSEILYIEVSKHDLIYHAQSGSFRAYGTLKAAEKELDAKQFVRCNSCYLVNLAYVRGIEADTVLLKNDRLPISRAKKKTFLQELNNYLGGNL